MNAIGLSIQTHEKEPSPPPGHPENAVRLGLIADALAAGSGYVMLESSPAPLATICRVHDAQYVETLIALAEQGGGMADGDTYLSTSSITAARNVAGALLNAIDRAFG